MVMKKYTKQLVPVIMAGLMTLYSTSALAGNEQRSGQAGATELLINPWASSSGWGGINIASVSGLEATFNNVAGLASTTGTELIFANTSLFGAADINLSAFGFAKSLDGDAALALSVVAMNFGDIEVTSAEDPEPTGATYSPTYMNIGLSYSKKFTDNILGGATVRMISESTPDINASGVALDAGIQYVAGVDRQIKFGIALKNVGPKMTFVGDGNDVTRPNPDTYGPEFSTTYEVRPEAFELPSLLNIGASYDVFIDQDSKVALAGSFTSNSFTKDQYGIGAEYGYKSNLKLRAGYVYEDGITDDLTRTTAYTGWNFGFSVNIPFNGTEFGLDYSYRAQEPFEAPQSIGVKIVL